MPCLDFFHQGGKFHIVMPCLDLSLGDAIANKEYQFTEAIIRAAAKQILRGLEAIHKEWFLHRDLRPENILLGTLSPHASVKIADFGLSRPFNHNRPMSTLTVQLCYRAPELLQQAKHYGPAVDMWSFGCVVAEMYLRKPMFLAECGSSFVQLQTIYRVRGAPTEENWPLATKLPFFVGGWPDSQCEDLTLRFPETIAL